MECRSDGLAFRIHGLGFRFQMQHVFGGWCVGVRSQHLTMYVLSTRLRTERERDMAEHSFGCWAREGNSGRGSWPKNGAEEEL